MTRDGATNAHTGGRRERATPLSGQHVADRGRHEETRRVTPADLRRVERRRGAHSSRGAVLVYESPISSVAHPSRPGGYGSGRPCRSAGCSRARGARRPGGPSPRRSEGNGVMRSGSRWPDKAESDPWRSGAGSLEVRSGKGRARAGCRLPAAGGRLPAAGCRRAASRPFSPSWPSMPTPGLPPAAGRPRCRGCCG
jgi:hypothetical protein